MFLSKLIKTYHDGIADTLECLPFIAYHSQDHGGLRHIIIINQQENNGSSK